MQMRVNGADVELEEAREAQALFKYCSMLSSPLFLSSLRCETRPSPVR